MGGGAFDDVLAANEKYAQGFALAGLRGGAARGLAVLTCIDARIEPLPLLGLAPGDAAILRTAGARVSDDVLATLVFAHTLLGVTRAMLVAHTDCGVRTESEDELHAAIQAAGGPDTRSLSFAVGAGREETVRRDVERIRAFPYLPGLETGGFVYDVATGSLSRVC